MSMLLALGRSTLQRSGTTSVISATICRAATHGILSANFSSRRVAKYKRIPVSEWKPKSHRVPPPPPDFDTEEPLDLDEYLSKIDTTLTPEEQERVEKIKQKMRGRNGKRSPFIDVPNKEEELKMGDCNGVSPQIAKNAQKLIDFALSFIPPRAGPRRTKEKKRMKLRREQRKRDLETLKENRVKAVARRKEKYAAHEDKAQAYIQEAERLRAAGVLKSAPQPNYRDKSPLPKKKINRELPTIKIAYAKESA